MQPRIQFFSGPVQTPYNEPQEHAQSPDSTVLRTGLRGIASLQLVFKDTSAHGSDSTVWMWSSQAAAKPSTQSNIAVNAWWYLPPVITVVQGSVVQ